MELHTWGIALLALMFVLFFIELLLPSGGMLGVIAGVVGIAGLVCLFRYDMKWGLSGLLSLLVLVPAFACFALRVWPSTPMGRRIIGMPSEEELEAKRQEELTEKQRLAALVGKEGVVLTSLRPVGVIDIEGVRYDALSETTYVPSGARVRVVHADGSQIKVRQVL
ncbi:MAG: hypothetical protein JSR77_12240 [Planctomycetes bacterium]|nr:hypothetical protein [Planctomycetota bacterium]